MITSAGGHVNGVSIQANGQIAVAGFAARLGGRFALARYLG
jgi:hypothetical protein